MPSTPLTPVFAALRTGLHILVGALLALVVIRGVLEPDTSIPATAALTAMFAGVYIAGARLSHLVGRRRVLATRAWLVALSAAWVALMLLTPEAAYLVFPLFFLYLHLLGAPLGPAAVVVSTTAAIAAIGLRDGFTLGGIVGPVVGAGVALLLGWGYQALAREATERERLLTELIATRSQLAATEREQGVATERARLAREIHDTVAQSLSSIQMLLHAAERADPTIAMDHVVLARRTAADALGETRHFIRELSPSGLDEGLPSALRRLASTYERTHALAVDVQAPGRTSLPMDKQAALLRIAQEALANIVQHAQTNRAAVALTETETSCTLTISDDGVGFDVDHRDSSSTSDSFGLRAIQERVEQIGGMSSLQSTLGQGTRLSVVLERTS